MPSILTSLKYITKKKKDISKGHTRYWQEYSTSSAGIFPTQESHGHPAAIAPLISLGQWSLLQPHQDSLPSCLHPESSVLWHVHIILRTILNLTHFVSLDHTGFPVFYDDIQVIFWLHF